MSDKPVEKNVRVHFKGIHPSAWEHPADRTALQALQNVPGLDIALKAFFGATSEKALRLQALASAVKVGPKQFPRIYHLWMETCQIFDVENPPELFISYHPVFNASAVGIDNPFVILNSSMVESLSDDETITVLGHELGHILSGHALYKTLLMFLLNVSSGVLMTVPLSALLLRGIILALLEWDRKSELSADRAGLLACQNPEVAIHLEMKLAGGNNLEEMNLGEFMKQAEEYNSAKSLSDTFYKTMNTMFRTHPYPITRLSELMKWIQSGDYESTLRGFYNKEDNATWGDHAKKAADGYTQDFKETMGPIFDEVKETANEATKKAKDIFEDIMKGK